MLWLSPACVAGEKLRCLVNITRQVSATGTPLTGAKKKRRKVVNARRSNPI
jgi:hypothetical protein